MLGHLRQSPSQCSIILYELLWTFQKLLLNNQFYFLENHFEQTVVVNQWNIYSWFILFTHQVFSPLFLERKPFAYVVAKWTLKETQFSWPFRWTEYYDGTIITQCTCTKHQQWAVNEIIIHSGTRIYWHHSKNSVSSKFVRYW